MVVEDCSKLGATATWARARTIGRAKAETTMPVVRNQAISLPGLEPGELSPCLLASREGRGLAKWKTTTVKGIQLLN